MNKITNVESNYKSVKYFGYKLVVPDWVDYVACDRIGTIYGFGCKPELIFDNSNPIDTYTERWYASDMKRVGSCNLNSKDWKSTMKKV